VSHLSVHYNWAHGMTVMDGRRVVAVAKPKGRSGWLLTLYGASWIDPRARNGGVLPGKNPNMLVVKSRHEAAIIMTDLAHAGR
jgi:hypothetical protein